jgi:hypothetical protein
MSSWRKLLSKDQKDKLSRPPLAGALPQRVELDLWPAPAKAAARVSGFPTLPCLRGAELSGKCGFLIVAVATWGWCFESSRFNSLSPPNNYSIVGFIPQLLSLPPSHCGGSVNSSRYVTMTEIYPSLAQCAIVAAAFKILLFPA